MPLAPSCSAVASGSRLSTELPLVRRRRRTRGRRSPAPASRRSRWRWRRRRARRALRRAWRSDEAAGTRPLPGSVMAEPSGKGGRVPSVISCWISRPSRVPSRASSHSCLPKTRSGLVMARTSPSISSTRWANSSSVRAWASTVAAMAPAEVAVTISGTMCSTPIRYWRTPTSKEPLVPPPARTNAVGPVRGGVDIRSILSPCPVG